MSDKLQEYEKLTEQLNREDAARFLTRAKQRGTYICPFCNNGSGETGDGITKQKGSTRYTCFKCKAQGDKGSYTTIDLIGGLFGLEDFAEARNKAAELYGYALPGSDKAADPKYKEALKKKQEAAERKAKFEEIERKKQEEAERIDYTAYYKDRAEHITETDYMQSRGISLETCKHFLVGYEPEWRHPKTPQTVPTSERVIIPISRYNYLARAINNEVPEKYQKQRVGKSDLFNKKALNTAALVFITEGEPDAMSIYEAGHEAIATGSAANKQLVIDEIARRIDQSEHIPLLAIVPDKDETGDKAAKYIINEAEKLGVKIYTAAELTGAYKDSNDYLKADREAFIMAVNDKAREIMADNTAADHNEITEPKPETAEEKEKREKEEAESFLNRASVQPLVDFISTVGNGKSKREIIPTGFKELDKILGGGLTEGLCTIGAVSSLGKTSFCLQLADNIASSGRPVIYISLEMPADELISKIISRRLYASQKLNITAGELLRGVSKENFIPVMDELRSMGETPFYYFEGSGDIGAEIVDHQSGRGVKEITQRVIESRRKAGQPDKTPVVIVDYLQILQPKDMRATDKANNDFNVVKLKTLSRELKCPVIAISSFNRQNYNADADYSSFKETGAIEYTSDIVLALQFACMSKNADKVQEEIKKQIQQGKEGHAQELEIKILKNRMGFKDTLPVSFVPKYNYFAFDDFLPVGDNELPFDDNKKIDYDIFANAKKVK